MKIIIEYQGNTYESKEDKNHTAEQIKDMMYKDFGDMNKLNFELKHGGFIILGSDALRSCVIKILDT